MNNKLLLIVLLTLASHSFGQTSYDQRLLAHFTEEQLAQMPQQKLQAVTYYYCESYAIDASHAAGFEISSFDVSSYEDLRRESVDFAFTTEQGVIVTLYAKQKFLPKATLAKQP